MVDTKSPEITEVGTEGLDIDLTHSTPPPVVSSEEVAAEAAEVAAEMDAVMANAPVSPALVLPETAPELPEAPEAPEAPAAESAPSEGDAPLAPSADDLVALAEVAAAAAEDPQGSVVVTPAAEVPVEDETPADPASLLDAKLARYTAALHMGGTFHMPGSSISLTIAGDPYLDEDGLVYVICQKPSRHMGVICVEGLLDAV